MTSSTLNTIGSRLLARILSAPVSASKPVASAQSEVGVSPVATPPDTFVDPIVGSGEDGVQNPVVRTVSSEASDVTSSSVGKPTTTSASPAHLPERKKRSPPPDMSSLYVSLFGVHSHAKALPSGDFEIGGFLHALFGNRLLVSEICRHLAYPYADEERERIAAVIGLGAYGLHLAEGIAPLLLAPSKGGVAGTQVRSFPVEKAGDAWHFASDEAVGEELKGKCVLVVCPVLTPSTFGDIEACLRLIEGPKKGGGLGNNITVLGVATPFVFNCKPELRRAGRKPLPVTKLLSVSTEPAR